MKLKKLNQTPKNPRHFLNLMFSKMKNDPKVKENNDYLRIDKELMNKALVECAYGFFWISKDKSFISKDFF